MSLAGRPHPRRLFAPGVSLDVDDRAITAQDFAPLHARFGFTIDVCATADNARLERFLTAGDDALATSWAGERVWCNPPYSNIRPWVAKAWAEHNGGCPLVVMLVPADRTEQPWWQDLVEPVRDSGGGLACEFLPGRLRFLRAGQRSIRPTDRPPFGCCLLIWSQ